MSPLSIWILLLRGINVGGKHRLTMQALKDELASFQLDNVKTYIQSGNVTFQSTDEVPPSLADEIASRIEAHHGFRPRILLLRADQFKQAITANPFPEAEAEPKTLHLFFLTETPEAPDLEALEALQSATEQFSLIGHVFYLHAPDGIGRSKLAENVERHLGVPTTARNWRTVQKLREMIEGDHTA